MIWFKDFSPAACKCLRTALRLAGQWGQVPVTTCHLLLGIMREDTGEASAFLARYKVRYCALEQAVRQNAEGQPLKLTPHDFSLKAVQCLPKKTQAFCCGWCSPERPRGQTILKHV